jgi:DNA-binding CsgD family transcriptional regulator
MRPALAFMRGMEKAADSIGEIDFYDRLLEAVGSLVPHDLPALVRYSRTSPPDLVLPRIHRPNVEDRYGAYFYVFDPFYTYWRDGGAVGVVSLRLLAPADLWRSRYALEFLRDARIDDEIALFLPPFGDASPTLLLDRAKGRFSPAEMGRVRRVYPLVAAIHNAHLKLIIGTGADLSGTPFDGARPLRIVDQAGRELVATPAWHALLTGPGEIAGTVARLGATGPCTVALGPRLLRRTRLPYDFGPAPGGYCDMIVGAEGLAGAAPEGLPEALRSRLTVREVEIVTLTLQGFPVIEIARRLGLSRGTVKNHRGRIYDKLDITTERELFLEYISALRPPA